MRYRLLTTIALVVIVGGLYLYTTRDTDRQTEPGSTQAPSQAPKSQPADDADSMKNLKVD